MAFATTLITRSGIRHEAEDSFLKIQRQKRRFLGSSFMRYSFLYLGGKLS
jgi:hypothetical protein